MLKTFLKHLLVHDMPKGKMIKLECCFRVCLICRPTVEIFEKCYLVSLSFLKGYVQMSKQMTLQIIDTYMSYEVHNI